MLSCLGLLLLVYFSYTQTVFMSGELLFISNSCAHTRSQPTMLTYPKPSGNIFPATSCPHSLEMFGLASFRGWWAHSPSFLFLSCPVVPTSGYSGLMVYVNRGMWQDPGGQPQAMLIGPGIRKTLLPHEPRLAEEECFEGHLQSPGRFLCNTSW